ncbi:chemotaxis protein CheB [Variovorax sp. N23]|uniref:chemotaxis protein CheB n=1 Tax=Variovorax sp. N23 TaxID=2980555 RepID=UPI0021C80427|nr:chemotaxis protein CheB [Variovorax sp. N23]MCU4118623.1 chemotaxis protein CheB [Variovorax sp. N23]
MSGDHTPAQKQRRDVVVIGAGSGGLTAVCKLLGDLPRTFDAAILLALDAGSQPASSVLQILRGYSHIPVIYAADGVMVRRGRVVVAPARQHMVVVPPEIISLEYERSFSEGGPSVNRLFETAAAAFGRRVIGIVLSGASHDGAAGLTRIEAAGGLGVVQEPREAAESGMPARALRLDHPDYCCTLEQMAPLLVKLVDGELPAFASIQPGENK